MYELNRKKRSFFKLRFFVLKNIAYAFFVKVMVAVVLLSDVTVKV